MQDNESTQEVTPGGVPHTPSAAAAHGRVTPSEVAALRGARSFDSKRPCDPAGAMLAFAPAPFTLKSRTSKALAR